MDVMCKPEIRCWSLVSFRSHALRRDGIAMKEINSFLRSNEQELDMAERKCCLRGFVYGHEKFNDEDLIDTSYIVRIAQSNSNDYLVASTKTGSKYYLKKDEISY